MTIDDKLVSVLHLGSVWAACVVPPMLIIARGGLVRAMLGYAAGLGLGVVAALACFVLLDTTKEALGRDLLQSFCLPLVGLAIGYRGEKQQHTRTVPIISQGGGGSALAYASPPVTGGASMAARLGNVLYWACSLFAGLTVAILVAVPLLAGGWTDPIIQLVVFTGAVVIWLFGRACRYVLSDT